jgi:hypothetical protein
MVLTPAFYVLPRPGYGNVWRTALVAGINQKDPQYFALLAAAQYEKFPQFLGVNDGSKSWQF